MKKAFLVFLLAGLVSPVLLAAAPAPQTPAKPKAGLFVSYEAVSDSLLSNTASLDGLVSSIYSSLEYSLLHDFTNVEFAGVSPRSQEKNRRMTAIPKGSKAIIGFLDDNRLDFAFGVRVYISDISSVQVWLDLYDRKGESLVYQMIRVNASQGVSADTLGDVYAFGLKSSQKINQVWARQTLEQMAILKQITLTNYISLSNAPQGVEKVYEEFVPLRVEVSNPQGYDIVNPLTEAAIPRLSDGLYQLPSGLGMLKVLSGDNRMNDRIYLFDLARKTPAALTVTNLSESSYLGLSVRSGGGFLITFEGKGAAFVPVSLQMMAKGDRHIRIDIGAELLYYMYQTSYTNYYDHKVYNNTSVMPLFGPCVSLEYDFLKLLDGSVDLSFYSSSAFYFSSDGTGLKLEGGVELNLLDFLKLKAGPILLAQKATRSGAGMIATLELSLPFYSRTTDVVPAKNTNRN